ncbi:MarR family transcriptional regulator [Anaerovorax odorimutans]|uniref:MarR family transcriptional regulator n=1 Tax=Anaerovorax odorimutans TaxID=109327 RepID=A0ABT1RJ66_9FIRM|nr:MarR family winged helix-turn-helix transcriptional regulator [Anaerovorax odorimutans]MCQ4635220.1 MarR family transcriptional regulator [Anaerovorax odorimutans]
MDKRQLRDSFLGSLQKMYDMELVAPLMEFCQGEMRVLLYLDAHEKEDIYPSALSEALFVTRQRITTILSALRKKGYITMETAEKDRRRMRIILSAAGRRYVIEKRRFVENYFDMLLEALGEENMREFQRLVQLTAEKMEGIAK